MSDTRIIYKSSIDGEFVSKAFADANPNETYETEVGREAALEEALRVMVGYVKRNQQIVWLTDGESNALEFAETLLD